VKFATAFRNQQPISGLIRRNNSLILPEGLNNQLIDPGKNIFALSASI